ncbi:MAG TPA: hypothetical protein DEB06_08665 [Phycisphaerales bacterium]|nr:hypothetical protein [Phycisphaerales bacterium]
MNQDTQTDGLASLLEGDPLRPLTTDERALIRAALAELAHAQAVIDTQGRLLESFEEDASEIERAARAALGPVRAVEPGYDFEATRAARAQLLKDARGAADASRIVSLALRFVRTIAAL